MTDPLSRLRDGLARDAEIARAAGERATEWRAYGGAVAGGPFLPADPEWGVPESGDQTIVYDEGWPLKPEAQHIAEFDPARVLRQVDKLRELVDEARFVLGKNDPGLTDAGILAESVIDTLASIYTEDTETGDAQ